MNATDDIDIAIPSICPFVCPWHSGIVSQQLNMHGLNYLTAG